MIPSSKSFDNPGFKDEPLGCATHAWSPQKNVTIGPEESLCQSDCHQNYLAKVVNIIMSTL